MCVCVRSGVCRGRCRRRRPWRGAGSSARGRPGAGGPSDRGTAPPRPPRRGSLTPEEPQPAGHSPYSLGEGERERGEKKRGIGRTRGRVKGKTGMTELRTVKLKTFFCFVLFV